MCAETYCVVHMGIMEGMFGQSLLKGCKGAVDELLVENEKSAWKSSSDPTHFHISNSANHWDDQLLAELESELWSGQQGQYVTMCIWKCFKSGFHLFWNTWNEKF